MANKELSKSNKFEINESMPSLNESHLNLHFLNHSFSKKEESTCRKKEWNRQTTYSMNKVRIKCSEISKNGNV